VRSVLVTGGTTRLGKAIADHLAERGWRVVRSSHRPDAGADAVADLAREGGADALFAAVCGILGEPPDAIVNNAALYVTCKDAAAVAAVNCRAPMRLAALLARTGGAVVNILDAAVDGSNADRNAYTRAKFALAGFTTAENAEFGGALRINGVAPGAVLSPVGMHEKAPPLPFGRPKPCDVACAVESLLDSSANRQILPVTRPLGG